MYSIDFIFFHIWYFQPKTLCEAYEITPLLTLGVELVIRDERVSEDVATR